MTVVYNSNNIKLFWLSKKTQDPFHVMHTEFARAKQRSIPIGLTDQRTDPFDLIILPAASNSISHRLFKSSSETRSKTFDVRIQFPNNGTLSKSSAGDVWPVCKWHGLRFLAPRGEMPLLISGAGGRQRSTTICCTIFRPSLSPIYDLFLCRFPYINTA